MLTLKFYKYKKSLDQIWVIHISDVIYEWPLVNLAFIGSLLCLLLSVKVCA